MSRWGISSQVNEECLDHLRFWSQACRDQRQSWSFVRNYGKLLLGVVIGWWINRTAPSHALMVQNANEYQWFFEGFPKQWGTAWLIFDFEDPWFTVTKLTCPWLPWAFCHRVGWVVNYQRCLTMVLNIPSITNPWSRKTMATIHLPSMATIHLNIHLPSI